MRLLACAVALVLVLAGCGGAGGTRPTSIASAGAAPAAESGGEKGIEDFGAEASGARRAALIAAFRGYLDAIGRGRYASACFHLSAAVKRSLTRLTGASKRLSCATILPRLLAPGAARVAREQAEGDLVGVRVKGNGAFVVFHAPGARLYQLPLSLEGGRWKASTLGASVLVPTLATLDGER